MAKNEYILNIGDDNVVLTKISDAKVANAWLGSPDPAMAIEELGEALAEDPKARISVLFDTLDQSFKEEEIPRVSILDRRKLLARHINMAFPGMNLRGARLVTQTEKKTLIYELASVPLDGRVPGWLDFVQSLPNEKAGIFALAAENIDIVQKLTASDATPPETGNHWRHFIGINVTGGVRQIIEKNGRLCLTRLTQAPPPDTSPTEFADMIGRDFKATITYIRRLGYQVGEPLDLVVLTTADNKRALEDMTWDGARSAIVYTPYEAGAVLGLGSIGREDQAYCDVLHAAWFASKRKGTLPLSKTAAMGDAKDDLRELAFFAAPYAAGLLVASVVGWSAWNGYQWFDYASRNEALSVELSQVRATLAQEQDRVGKLPHEPVAVRNVIQVADALDTGKTNFNPVLQRVAAALEGDAVVTNLRVVSGTPANAPVNSGGARKGGLAVDIDLRLSSVIRTAEEASQTTRRLTQRLTANFAPDYTVTVTKEPLAAQAAATLTGSLGAAASEVAVADQGAGQTETFVAAFHIEKNGP